MNTPTLTLNPACCARFSSPTWESILTPWPKEQTPPWPI